MRLKDNSRRGDRTIFFLKFWLILIVVVLVQANISIEIPNHLPPLPETTEGMNKDTILQLYHTARRLYYLIMANLVLMVGAIVMTFVTYALCFVYRILWFYRAIKNLRCLTKTTFSPNVAIICTALLPVIGLIPDVFILWDIARRQQKLLDKRGIQYTPVTRCNLVIFFVFALVGIVIAAELTEIAVSWPGCFVACAAFIGLMISWLRVLRPCVEQGNMLYQLQQKEIVRAKEDETQHEHS